MTPPRLLRKGSCAGDDFNTKPRQSGSVSFGRLLTSSNLFSAGYGVRWTQSKYPPRGDAVEACQVHTLKVVSSILTLAITKGSQ